MRPVLEMKSTQIYEGESISGGVPVINMLEIQTIKLSTM
jgi:hypothetical protein